jgi:hypothetical protein
VRPDTLRQDLLARVDLQSERIAIERQRAFEILHGDADVIEERLHPCFTGGGDATAFVPAVARRSAVVSRRI